MLKVHLEMALIESVTILILTAFLSKKEALFVNEMHTDILMHASSQLKRTYVS